MSQVLGSQIEQALAGMMLNSPEAAEECYGKLQEEDFTTIEPRLIFRSVKEMLAAGHTVDALTVSEWIRTSTGRDLTSFIQAVVNASPEGDASHTYITQLRERTAERNLMTFKESVGKLVDGGGPVAQRYSALQAELEKVFTTMEEENTRTLGEVFQSTMDLVARAAEGTSLGLMTGFKDLDAMTGGLFPGDLIIVAGRPAMGKTSFAMNIGENVAERKGSRVMVFSMEMPKEQLAMRMFSGMAGVDLKNLRTGTVTDDDMDRIENAAGRFEEDSIIFNDISGLTFAALHLEARKAKRKYGKLDLIVVDYLQLMEGDGNRSNRNDEITKISRGLKKMAKELGCPVIALSQLSRDCEKRQDKRPMCSDLRESGAIEQDADVILFVYRDEVYNPNTRFKDMAEIIIGKQRNGPIGTVELAFLRQHSRFANAEPRPVFVPSDDDADGDHPFGL
jgi:replicative DNA helicase